MRRDWPDILGGLALAAIGAMACAWALIHYDFGTLRQMGPGFFPTILGAGLALLGLIVALPALIREAVKPERFDLASAAAVLGGVLVFGFGLRYLGLAGSTFAATLVASLAAPQPGRLWRLVLAIVVAALTVLIFSYGLRMTLPLWPRLP